jgi:hypothetical protein
MTDVVVIGNTTGSIRYGVSGFASGIAILLMVDLNRTNNQYFYLA